MINISLLISDRTLGQEIKNSLKKDYQISDEFKVEASDLVIVDTGSLAKLEKKLFDKLKNRAAVLCLLNESEEIDHSQQFFQQVDDFIFLPLRENELRWRIERVINRKIDKKRKDTFENIFGDAPTGILISRLDGKQLAAIEFANKSAQEIFQYSDNDFSNLKLSDLVVRDEDDRKKFEKFLKEIHAKQSGRAEFYHLRKTGSAFIGQVEGWILEREDSKYLITAIEDVTEIRKQYENLSLNEERYRYITRVVSDYLYSFKVLEDGTMQGDWISGKFYPTFGYTISEINARGGWQSMVHPDDLPIALAHAKKVANGEPDICEMRFVTRDGRARWLRDYAVPVWDKKKQRVIKIYGASQDITEKKEVEIAIKESEANLRSLINARKEAIWAVDKNLCYTVTNDFFKKEYERVYGIKLEKGMNALEILSDELRDFWEPRYRAALAGESQQFEFQENLPDGLHTYQVILNPIIIDGAVEGISAISTDITEKKEILSRLRESEERFRLAFHTSPDSINLNRLRDGLYLDINEGFTRITGYTREDVIGKTSLELSIWADPNDRRRLVDGLMKNGKVENLEAKFRMKDGTIVTGLMSAAVIKLNGEPHIISITRNIEHLKQLEKERELLYEEAQKTKALLSSVFERITDGVVALDNNWCYTYVNRQAAKMLNREKPEDLVGKHIWTEYPEGVGQPFHLAYERAMKTQQTIYLEEFYEPWGRWFENRIYPSENGITIYFTEVTERKLAEKRLKQSEDRYRSLFENSPVPLWEEDCTEMLEYLNQVFNGDKTKHGLKKYFDENPDVLKDCAKKIEILDANKAAIQLYEAKSLKSLKDKFPSLISDELFAETFKKEVINLMLGRKIFSSEATIKTLTDKSKDIYLKYVVYPMHGLPDEKSHNKIILSTLDITPLKNAQRALEKSLRELDCLYSISIKARQVEHATQLAKEVIEIIRKAINPDVCLFFLVQGEKLVLLSYFTQIKNFDKKAAEMHKVGECLCGLTALKSESVFSLNIFEDARCTLEECKQAGLRSFAGLPLMKAGEAIGVLGLGSMQIRDFEAERPFLETIANETAISLQNTLLLEELRQHQRTLEEKVMVRTSELRQANEELESFTYSVSHDLRAPLRAIDGFSGLLEEKYMKDLDDEARRLLSVVRENTQRMSVLIDDLLKFSRIGRKALECREVDMNEIFSSAFRELTDDDQKKRIKFILHKLPKAYVDESLIRQVALNLLSNAIKFSSVRETPKIEIGARTSKDRLTYFVKDNGVGFNMKYSEKLFQVFQRLHGEKEFSGTGIGLSLVQRIILRHGGKIWAESEPGNGATFYFSLPKNRS